MSKENGALSRGDILGADDLDIEPVEVPEWGGTVYIRQLTGAEREAFEDETLTGDPSDPEVVRTRLRERLLVKTLCGPDGDRLLEDGDEDELAEKSGDVIGRLFQVSQEINGMTPEAVEELLGN